MIIRSKKNYHEIDIKYWYFWNNKFKILKQKYRTKRFPSVNIMLIKYAAKIIQMLTF